LPHSLSGHFSPARYFDLEAMGIFFEVIVISISVFQFVLGYRMFLEDLVKVIAVFLAS